MKQTVLNNREKQQGAFLFSSTFLQYSKDHLNTSLVYGFYHTSNKVFASMSSTLTFRLMFTHKIRKIIRFFHS